MVGRKSLRKSFLYYHETTLMTHNNQKNILMRFTLTLLYCLSNSLFLAAQNIPPYPTHLDLQKITTPHFTIIHPKGIAQEAQRVANLCEYVFPYETKSLSLTQWKKFPLILSNQNMTANAYVTLAMRKSEWYNQPGNIAMGATEWYQDLALHEMRHMVQFEKIKQSGSTLPNLFFGELGQAFQLLFLPPWFYEGDAVVTETALSKSGRGRLPSFSQHYRAMLLDSLSLQYAPAVYQSYKNFYPNHYVLGYFFNAYLRQEYGTHVWNKLFQDVRWERNLKYLTHQRKEQVFENFAKNLKQKTLVQITDLDTTAFQIITPSKKRFENFTYPNFINDTECIAVHHSLQQANALVKINIKTNLKTHLLFYKPIQDNPLHISNAQELVWVEQKADKIFSEKDFGVIMLYQLQTKKKIQLTHKTKYYVAALSPNGNLIAAVSFDENRNCVLSILDKTGMTKKKCFSSNEIFIGNISWNKNSDKLVFTKRTKENEVQMSIYNLATDQENIIQKHEEFIFSNPIFGNQDKSIYYHNTQSGIDNIFVYDIEKKVSTQITSDKIGADFPFWNKATNDLYYSHYTSKGYEIVKQIQTKKMPSTERWNTQIINYHDALQKQEAGHSILDSFQKMPFTNYPSKPYQGLANFRFHSWLPTTSTSLNNNGLGLSLIGTDLMNSIEVNPFIGISNSENGLLTGVSIAYQKFFPSFSANYTLQNRNVNQTFTLQPGLSPTRDSTQDLLLSWQTQSLSLGVLFPFNFSRALHHTQLSLSHHWQNNYSIDIPTTFAFNRTTNKIIIRERANTQSSYLIHQLRFVHAFSAIVQADLLARNSQNITVTYSQGLTKSGTTNLFQQITLRSEFVFPAFLHQDRFVFSLNAEQRNAASAELGNLLSYPKGYGSFAHQNLYRASVNYLTSPLSLDWQTPNWLQYITLFLIPKYSKAVRFNLFSDNAYATTTKSATFRSMGVDMIYEGAYISNPIALIPFRFSFAYTPDAPKPLAVELGVGLRF